MTAQKYFIRLCNIEQQHTDGHIKGVEYIQAKRNLERLFMLVQS